MGRVIPDTNLPPGLSTAHPHFWENANWPDLCPGCNEEVGDEPLCPLCGYALDPEEVQAIERELDCDRRYDMERER